MNNNTPPGPNIDPSKAHILGREPAPETKKGTKLRRDDAVQAMIDVGYEPFEAELVAQLVHYVECVPGLVKLGSPHRDKILNPIADLQAAIASIVTSRRLQAKVQEILESSEDTAQD